MIRLLFVCFLGAVAVNAHNFTNPLVEGGSDPWMVYYKGFYYLLVTPWNNIVRMRKSDTLDGLRTAENVQIYSFEGSIGWAPEIHLVNGKWYLYYAACPVNGSNMCHKNHVAESAGEDPMGPYTFKTTFVDPQDPDVRQEIDPSLLRVNNKLYLLGSNVRSDTQGLYVRELSNPYTAVGTKSMIAKPIYDWEKSGWYVNEGPEPLYHDGRIFVVFSASGCTTPDYKLGLIEFVGSDPMNADHWKKYPNPVLVRDDEISVYGPGHNGFFMSPDGKEYWIVYHANSKLNGTCDGRRNPRAKKFTFGDDGLPVFGLPDAAGVVLVGPSGEPQ